jgi:ABC-2 type transport system ATP-binding protein
MSAPGAVELRGVYKSYPQEYRILEWIMRMGRRLPRRIVLEDIDLHVEAGTVFGLLGPNGAGKTTLLKMMSTLLLPDNGTIEVAGIDAIAHPMEVKQRIGLCSSEERSFYYRLTARANLLFFGTLTGIPRAILTNRIAEVARLVDITDALDREVRAYSTGMRQRLAVARAMLGDPQVLFFDEPTRAVDPVHTEAIRCLLRDRLSRQLGKTVIVCTNVLAEAWSICDQVAILSRGRIAALGSPLELGARFADRRRYAIALDRFDPKLVERLRELNGIAGLEVIDGVEPGLIVDLDLRERNLTALLGVLGGNGVTIRGFRQLEEEPFDVFCAATAEPDDGR